MGSLASFRLLSLFEILLLLSVAYPCRSRDLTDSSYEVSNHQLNRRLLSGTPKKVIKQYLLPHNRVRTKLSLPKLQWSEKLARYASWWAHQLQKDCELKHSNTDYGENLFWGSGKDWKPGDAVMAWAEEKIYYNHSSNSCIHDQQCLHYTQIVWRQSRKVGCARVTCRNGGGTIIGCNYYPHGNVIGEKPF